MEDPVREIPGVIAALTQTSPAEQAATIEKYFTPDASFTHPFCRTGSYDGSRDLIGYVYRWYKILSPRIELQVHSVAFDERNLLLYVTLHQIFAIQFFPFHRASVDLTTVLTLTKHSPRSDLSLPPSLLEKEAKPKYYIKAQNDLYQTSEFIKFLLPWFNLGNLLVVAWQYFATFQCMILAYLFWPITWIEQNVWGGNRKGSLVEVVQRR